jgi:hypothetical protein
MKTRDPFFALFLGVCVTAALGLGTNVCGQDASPATGVTSPNPAPASTLTSDTEFGDGVTVELQSVTRGEGDVTIKFKYTNNGSKTADFSRSNYGHANIAAVVYYVDPKNKKKYTVIKDAEDKPLASLMQSFKLEAGASKSGWCKLPAPPAEITSVTVVMPGAPPFEKVKVATP